jgi:hypothetical protein
LTTSRETLIPGAIERNESGDFSFVVAVDWGGLVHKSNSG